MKYIIEHLSNLVDEVIHNQMRDFIVLGRKAKQMALDNKPKKDLEEIHKKMIKIFKDLSPFEHIAREQYSEFVDLFNLLK